MPSLKSEHDNLMKEHELDPDRFKLSDYHNTKGEGYQCEMSFNEWKDSADYVITNSYDNSNYKLNIPDDTKIDWTEAQTDWINNKMYESTPSKDELKFSNYAEEYNFSEDIVIKELTQYIGSTYSSHYTNSNNSVQALDMWKSRGSMTNSCIDTTIKYLMRYGKKDGKNRKDLLKAAHYIILALGNE